MNITSPNISVKTFRFLFPLILTGMIFLISSPAFGVKAKPGIIKIEQPDGTIMEVRMRGDERSHIITDLSGHQLNFDSVSGLLHRIPGKLEASAWPQLISTRSNGELADATLKAEGSPRCIVILCEFQTEKFRMENPRQYYRDWLNEEGFSDYGATGSVADYFRDSSSGKFTPVFDVFGPVLLPSSRIHYGKNDYFGNEPNAWEMVRDAARLLDGEIDFSLYNNDGDRYADNVFIIYAGYGEADSGRANCVWPHTYDLLLADPGNRHVFDGITLNRYACTNEQSADFERPAGIGTFVHEFGHVLGLPDLYSTVYNEAETPGEWSVMDAGSYNNDGLTPPLHSSYERYSLGWSEPVPVGIETLVLQPLHSTGQCYIIPTEHNEEYFLLENRQLTGWDRYLPTDGMLVWHIDFDQAVWNDNKVNNDPAHQRIDLLEADNLGTEDTRDSDAYPNIYGNNTLSSTSTPALKSWNGHPTGWELTDIRNEGENIAVTCFQDSNGLTAHEAAGWFTIDGLRLSAETGLTVYTANGLKIGSGQNIALPADGLYIIRSERDQTAKVYIRQ